MQRDHRDLGTRIGVVRKAFSPLSTEKGAAFSVALFEEIERLRAERPTEAATGIVAAWHDSNGARQHALRVVFHRSAEDDVAVAASLALLPAAISIGRHTQCDISEIPGASLRHALLLLWPPAPDAAPRMEAIDLHTGIGLSVGEGQPATHIEGAGAVRFGVGGAEVVVLPARAGVVFLPAGPKALLDNLSTGPSPVRAVLAEADKAAFPVVEKSSVAWAHRRESSSVVASLTALKDIPTSLLKRDGTRKKRVDGRVHIVVTAPEVVDGVLLGRYPRCSGSDALKSDDSVSRVHAFVFSRGDRMYAVDAGSTNGTDVMSPGGCARVSLNEDVRIAVLEDGDRLLLGDTEVALLIEGVTPNVPDGGVA